MHLINSNCTVKRRATLSVAETEVLNFSLVSENDKVAQCILRQDPHAAHIMSAHGFYKGCFYTPN